MTEWLRQALGRILREDTGSNPGTDVIVAAALRARQRISRQIAPLIGEAAASAIEIRSLHQTQAAFPWFAAAESGKDGEAPVVAMEAATSMLVAFVELLASFIGKDPTIHLLRQAWPEGYFDGPAEV